MELIKTIRELFATRGGSQYGREAVTQQEHALQAAALAEAEGASPALITAALLHDVGHLLHDLPEDAPDQGIDDRHEELAGQWLATHFGPDVSEPARLHVDAKRYLCTTSTSYAERLSGPSLQSLELQGGLMSPTEAADFQSRPGADDAVRLRIWDDEAKVIDLQTPDLEHFLRYVRQCLNGASDAPPDANQPT
ncbi:hypothetical protein Mal4_12590 [Maioricimonas rarisocia]|uniref:HD domain protein n=1 Tax=Maioricimonas rarisocia TaxID=2528026 RepID=A0A517Z3D6_9PLAN|nr:phosphonate degradation HD-domain oxygenase [Maioricimonas rarisocia]QDU36956.1 hypothetical protein Mal4_12590 [Maioricimonas rarisocia]